MEAKEVKEYPISMLNYEYTDRFDKGEDAD